MKPEPARLEPLFVHRIWGARSLSPLFPEKTNLAEPIGEVWLTGNECRFASGPFAGKPLGEAWRRMPPAWAGSRVTTAAPFPLLIKFLFPEDLLSVQVHPDDDYARQHEAASGWSGKTEMWYALAARPGAEVLVGLQPGVRREQFRSAIAGGTVGAALQRVPVAAGDVISVPAGTVHTIGPGIVLCEIQQQSDLTYRVYDYGRTLPDGTARPLHIEKALEVARFGPQLGGKLAPLARREPGRSHAILAACRYFLTEKWEFAARTRIETSAERFELLIVLEGRGAFHWHGQDAEFAPAEAWFLPAALGTLEVHPRERTVLLRVCVPDLAAVERELAAQGFAPEEISRILFP